MKSKNQIVRELVSEKKYKEALQICKDWIYEDPNHSKILRLGYECLMYPGFYKQIGKDPEEAYEEAVRVLNEIYGTH